VNPRSTCVASAASRRHGQWRGIAVLLALATLLSSCAYYNTFYLARKYYFRATDGKPYLVEPQGGAGLGDFNKSIDYSKKLLANYPKSKLVDDAYLMWARSLLGKEDPLETVSMLTDFSGKYPASPVASDAQFYTGVAYRRARKYTEALTTLESFTKEYPKHDMVPYAYLEQSFALTSLGRPADAAAAASVILDRYRKSPLVDRALAQRADALYAAKSYDRRLPHDGQAVPQRRRALHLPAAAGGLHRGRARLRRGDGRAARCHLA
jgi:tetratricopeptide (TPR) repeat protein